ncbi:MAG: HAD family hydrolase [Prevotella sp.]|jgi:putative hydrolase of the HAD superfamily|nr:HAD family hydrolase [Prevotella sp.]
MNKGYIFDYGGTLDTGGQHWGMLLWHAFERHQVPVSESQFRDAYVYAERTLGRNKIIQPTDTFLQTLKAKVQLELTYLNNESYTDAIVSDVYERTKSQTALSRRVLMQMKASPMVLVSNFYGNISVVLQEFGLDGIFEEVIESAVVGIRKPDPQIFLLGVDALGMKPEEVTVVGDSLEKDIIPAKRAGCHTVWLKGEGWTNARDGENQADRVIMTLDELLQ